MGLGDIVYHPQDNMSEWNKENVGLDLNYCRPHELLPLH